ncbi:MAG: hypothetical protein RIC55_27225 [Pirellulaceae bacterium]
MLFRLAGVVCLVVASAAIVIAARDFRETRGPVCAASSRVVCGEPAKSAAVHKPITPASTLREDGPRVDIGEIGDPTALEATPLDRSSEQVAQTSKLPQSEIAPTFDEPFAARPAAATMARRQAAPRYDAAGGAFVPPHATPAAHVEASDVDDRAIVRFAAGAVELRVPGDWLVVEFPVGREVRMVIAPQPLQNSEAPLRDGMWLTYHPRPPQASAPVDLNVVLPERLRIATDSLAQPGALDALTINGRPALRQQFALAETQAAGAGHRGFHVFVDSQWGLCEVHAVAPEALHDSRSAQFERMLDSLLVLQPRPPRQDVSDDLREVAPIVGSWKSLGGRMRIHGDGRIAVLLDKPQLASGQGDGKSKRPPVLVGRFAAEQDVLRVTWKDGSLLNFRWRLHGNDLLLTDHRGQVSQLQRLLE